MAKYRCFIYVFGFLILLRICEGEDPFERTIPRRNCVMPRPISGCQKTFLQAYPKVSVSGTGQSTADSYFLLYTRKNRKEPEFLHECGGKLPDNTNFNSRNPTQLVIHGALEGVCDVTWMRDMKDQLLIRGDYNVILVDYSWGSFIDYYDNVQNAKIVGHQLAILIDVIKAQTGAKAEIFHIIGHSLGAQIAGFAGQRTLLRRISGLDPAGPAYQNATWDDRLDRTDADFVDIIHTNAGRCLPFFGYPDPIGHADFYPNGGIVQLSCYETVIAEFLRLSLETAIKILAVPTFCFHGQSVQYFKATINPGECRYVGVECPDYETFKSGGCGSCGDDGTKCAVMGFDWEFDYTSRSDKPHKYYLDLDLLCPYCSVQSLK